MVSWAAFLISFSVVWCHHSPVSANRVNNLIRLRRQWVRCLQLYSSREVGRIFLSAAPKPDIRIRPSQRDPVRRTRGIHMAPPPHRVEIPSCFMIVENVFVECVKRVIYGTTYVVTVQYLGTRIENVVYVYGAVSYDTYDTRYVQYLTESSMNLSGLLSPYSKQAYCIDVLMWLYIL